MKATLNYFEKKYKLRMRQIKKLRENHNLYSISLFRLIWSVAIGTLAAIVTMGGFTKINPRNVSWISGDNLTAYVAQLYYLSDNWHLPLSANPNYGNELSTSLTYTGPSPILMYFQKIVGLNPQLQLFGFWVILNFILQIYFSLLVVKVLGGNLQQSILISILSISPSLIFRTQMHLWLISHFLILWALSICIKYYKFKIIKKIELSGIIALGFLINSYLLGMVLTMLLYPFLHDLIYKKEILRKKFSTPIVGLSTIFAVYLITEGINKQKTFYESIKMFFSSTYGYHHFNLLSFINPDDGKLAEANGGLISKGTVLNFSITKMNLGNTPGAYEGFAYLGLGAILLILLSVFIKSINLTALFQNSNFRIIFILLTAVSIFSITNRIGIGSFEYTFPIPVLATWALGIFRASGRFMWIVGYLILFLAAGRLIRESKLRTSIILLSLCLSFQILDLSIPMKNIYNGANLNKSSQNFVQISKPIDFDKFVIGRNRIEVWPKGMVSDDSYANVNYWAWSVGMTTDWILTSRENVFLRYREQNMTFNRICLGLMSENVVYMVPKIFLPDLTKSGCTPNLKKSKIYENLVFFKN